MLVTARSTVARQVCWAGQGPQLVVNRDTSATVYLGDDEGMDPGGNDVLILDPLGSLSLDGRRTWWAMTQTGTALVETVPGGNGWSPSPEQIALQLVTAGLAKDSSVQVVGQQAAQQMLAAAQGVTTELAALIASGAANGTPGGVPLLSKSTLIHQDTVSALAPGVGQILGPFPITQPGYEVRIDLSTGAAGACYVTYQVDWIDSGTGQNLRRNSYTAVAGVTGTPHKINGHGPTKANQIQITVSNLLASAGNIVTTVTQMQSSRIYSRDVWRSLDTTAPVGFTASGTAPEANVLMNAAPSVAAAGTQVRLLPLYTGQAHFSLQTASATSDAELIIATVGGVLANSQTIYDNVTDAKGHLDADIQLPRVQCQVTLKNSNAAAKVLSVVGLCNELET